MRQLNFILNKLGYGLVVLCLVVVVISSIIYLSPVDPARLTFGQRSDQSTVEAKRKALGLDQPLWRQLIYYLRDISPVNIIHKDNPAVSQYNKIVSVGAGSFLVMLKYPYLRDSYQTGRPVWDMLREAIPKTMMLAFAAMIFACLVGISLGFLSAVYKNKWIDHLVSFFAVLGYSVPSYVLAVLLALFFGYLLHAVTGLDIQGSIVELDDYGNQRLVWKNLVLPVIALGLRPVAMISQITRSSVLDVLDLDYIRTARAKGLSYPTILFKHVFKNALNPIVTATSGWLAGLLAGAFFVENVFNFKGLGDMTVQALVNFDIPVVIGSVIFTASVFIVINILVDIVYTWIDPKVKLE